MNRFVIGILAHVDSGKTTLSEALLYKTGEIRKIGRVDHKDAFLDTHFIERERGITIFSKQATLNFGNIGVTLLDTPGHVDFSAETERTLSVLDYAILVISGTDGVQNHTETLWRLLVSHNIPTFIFVNKTDIAEKSKNELMEEIKSKLSDRCVDFSDDKSSDFYENAAMCDDEMMEEFLETEAISREKLCVCVKKCGIFPCLFGSALKLKGVDELILCMEKYMLPEEKKARFGARVFKISEDERGERLTHLKITGGELKAREALMGCDREKNEWSEKVNQIRIYSGAKYNSCDRAEQGMICVVTGLSKTYPGQGLGFETDSECLATTPVLSYKVEICDGTDESVVLSKLRELEQEETTLNIHWNEYLREIYVCLMGEVQLEVLRQLFYERFNIKIDFGAGNIVYRETIEEPTVGLGHYEPLRHYAEVHLLLEPLKRGEGLKFCSSCSEDMLDRNWQRLILTHLAEKNHIGVLTGSPITDMKITLTAGKAHNKHTEGGDFRQATYRAVRQGLRSAKSTLLEPYYDFIITLPTENAGRAMTDISNMGGELSSPELCDGFSVIKGSAPVSKMRDYQKELIGYTRGRGSLRCTIKGYFKCHNEEEVIEKINYNCDADTDNTADSVFCSHGAGHTVKWDEVKNYMHVENKTLLSEKELSNVKITERRVREYADALEEDKELMKIFEMTYGAVKSDKRTALRTKKEVKESVKKYKALPRLKGPGYLLVDGYNIIFASDELKALAEKSLDIARNRLITLLCNYRAFTDSEIIAVFDAYKVKDNDGEVEKVGNIDVVYTKEAETADMYIEKTAHELSKEYYVKVATSDGPEQLIIFGSGAFRINAEAFFGELKAVESEIRKTLENQAYSEEQ